jgi:hypothetical protein
MGKKMLEVDVYGKTIPALRLYTKYGFIFVPSLSARNIRRGGKPVFVDKQ